MAVDRTTMEGADGNRIETELPSGDGKEATTERSPNPVEARVVVYKKGAWSKEEDEKLRRAVEEYGVRNWVTIEKFSGLARPAKNCRLRWLNYLRPNLKKYPFTEEEEKSILHLHSKYGNSWSRIASKLPGRSDNDVKNFWHKRAKKCQKQHLPIYSTTRAERRQWHVKEEPITDDKHFPSYPDHILPSTSIQLANTSRDASSMIHSTQTIISKSQQPELTHKTTPSPNTPTSQNFHLSPHQRSQSSSNAFFTPLIEPPILSFPQGRFKRFLTPQNQLSASVSNLSPSTAKASAFLPQHSSLQIKSSSVVESPTSPLKLKLSPGVPQQTIGSLGASLSSLSSPILRLSSMPVPSKSNLSIPHYSNVPLNSFTPAVQLASSIEPMTVDTNKVIPQCSSLKTKPNLVQFDVLEIEKTNRFTHEVESDTNLEIMEELREAQARVRFLKKRLRQKRISKKINLHKINTRKENFLGENLKATDFCGRELGKQVSLDEISSQMTPKESLSSMSSKTNDSTRIGGDIIIENKLSKLPKIESFESKKYRQGSIVSKKVTTHDEAYIENLESSHRREDSHSLGEIFKIKRAMNLLEQRHSIDSIAHPNGQNTMNGLNLDSWNDNLCPSQVPAIGKFLNGWSSLEGSFLESSTLLQDSLLKGDSFGQRSGMEQSHTNGFGTVYYQSTATTLVNPCDESDRLNYLQPDAGGYFGDNFGQKDASSMDGNLETLISSEANLLMHQNPATDSQEPSYLVSQLMREHESLGNLAESSKLCESSLSLDQCPTTNMLDSSYPVNKQIMGQESLQGGQISFQTFRGGNSAKTSKLCESIFLLDNYPATNMMDTNYQVCFENKCPRGEQYTLQTTACEYYLSDVKTNCISRGTWRQEPSKEESSMEAFLVENLWLDGRIVSQDQPLLPNIFDPIANPSGMTHLTKSKNWNNESDCGHAEIPNQEHDQEHDHMNSSIQPLEWNNKCNTIPDEYDKGLNLQVTSTSQPLLTTAEYL